MGPVWPSTTVDFSARFQSAEVEQFECSGTRCLRDVAGGTGLVFRRVDWKMFAHALPREMEFVDASSALPQPLSYHE